MSRSCRFQRVRITQPSVITPLIARQRIVRRRGVLARRISRRARTKPNAAPRCCARGPDRAVDAGRQSGEMASGARHMVLRAISVASVRAGLSAVRRALRVSVQLLLCGGRSAAGAAAARPDHAAWRCRDDAYRAHVDAAVARADRNAPETRDGSFRSSRSGCITSSSIRS